MPLNTGNYMLPYQMAPIQDPTTKPVIFNYADGATLAPKVDMTGYDNGVAAMGKGLAGGITQMANNIVKANQQQTPEQQAQAYALSQQALAMLQQQQTQGMSGFNSLAQQMYPQSN